MDRGLKKMWTFDRPTPMDHYRSTIFTSNKNIKNQYANNNGKRWKQDIIDQNSYMFAWNNVPRTKLTLAQTRSFSRCRHHPENEGGEVHPEPQ